MEARIRLGMFDPVGVNPYSTITAKDYDKPEHHAKALRMAPAETSRAAWTDWEGVRRELGAEVDAGSSAVEVDEFLS